MRDWLDVRISLTYEGYTNFITCNVLVQCTETGPTSGTFRYYNGQISHSGNVGYVDYSTTPGFEGDYLQYTYLTYTRAYGVGYIVKDFTSEDISYQAHCGMGCSDPNSDNAVFANLQGDVAFMPFDETSPDFDTCGFKYNSGTHTLQQGTPTSLRGCRLAYVDANYAVGIASNNLQSTTLAAQFRAVIGHSDSQ